MGTPAAIRKRKSRRRRALGLRLVKIELGEDAIKLLERRGYVLGGRTDTAIAIALTALVSDLVLEAA